MHIPKKALMVSTTDTNPQRTCPTIMTLHEKYITHILPRVTRRLKGQHTHAFTFHRKPKYVVSICHMYTRTNSYTRTQQDQEGRVLIAYHFQSLHSELVSKGEGGGYAPRTKWERGRLGKKKRKSAVRRERRN